MPSTTSKISLINRLQFLFLLMLTTVGLSAQAQNLVYVCAPQGIYSRSATSCAYTFVEATPIWFGDIAITSNGSMYGVGGPSYSNSIYVRNAQTGTWSAVLELPFGMGNVNALETYDDTRLLFAQYSNLYMYNIITNSFALIGDIGYNSGGDLAWYDDNLYMSTMAGLAKITLNEAGTALTGVQLLGVNQGTMGLATVVHAGFDKNIMLGFSESRVYRVCPITGISTLLCYQAVSARGATAMRLPAQVPAATACPVALGVEQVQPDLGLVVYPNPVDKTGIVNFEVPAFSEPLELEVYDMKGNLAFSGTVREKTYQLDCAALHMASGVYMARLSNAYLSQTVRLAVH